MFITSETTSPDLGSPIVSVSTVNPQMRPQDIDEQMERFSESSSIELVIQGGSYEPPQPLKVPDSHRMQFNPYPGAKNLGNVPIDIVKSFAPVISQNELKHRDDNDIYSDYVQDPYNLTLQLEAGNSGGEAVRNDSVPSASTIFQSSSYFSNEASDLTSPGSELFNRP